MGFSELKHGAGIEHVLGGRPEMEIFAVAVGAHRLELAQRRHQRMVDLADARADHFEVDVPDLGLAGDLVGRRLGDDAELGLRQGESRLEVEPLLDAILVVEDGAERFGAPQVLEEDGIEDAGGHVVFSPRWKKAFYDQ